MIETITWHTSPPLETGRYLVTIDGKVTVGYYFVDESSFSLGPLAWNLKGVIAWAEFPKGYSDG